MRKTLLKSIVPVFIFCSFLTSCSTSGSEKQSSGWKAGVAKVVITPDRPMWMAGYASREHASEGTLHNLWAKALALEDSSGNRVILITTDILGFPGNISDRIRTRLNTEYGLTKAQVALSSSHTHTGPVLQNALFDIYPLDSAEREKIRIYSIDLENKIVALAGEALESMVPVSLYSQNGIVRFQVNRRNNSEKLLEQTTTLNGPNDYSVPVLKVSNEAGDIMAVIFGYACHATVLNFYEWSGDYPGFAQIELEKEHPGLTAMFFQGAGADQNPLPRRTVPLAQQYGRELADAVERVLKEEMRKLPATVKTAYSEIELPLSDPLSIRELEKRFANSTGFEKRWANHLIEIIKQNGALISSYNYPIQIWKLGDQPVMILGGEAVVEYAILLKQLFGNETFVMAYTNDVMSYIPSEKILEEGGYEGESSQIVYGMPGKWKSGIETIIIEEMTKLAEEAGLKKADSI